MQKLLKVLLSIAMGLIGLIAAELVLQNSGSVDSLLLTVGMIVAGVLLLVIITLVVLRLSRPHSREKARQQGHLDARANREKPHDADEGEGWAEGFKKIGAWFVKQRHFFILFLLGVFLYMLVFTNVLNRDPREVYEWERNNILAALMLPVAIYLSGYIPQIPSWTKTLAQWVVAPLVVLYLMGALVIAQMRGTDCSREYPCTLADAGNGRTEMVELQTGKLICFYPPITNENRDALRITTSYHGKLCAHEAWRAGLCSQERFDKLWMSPASGTSVPKHWLVPEKTTECGRPRS